MSPAVLGIDTSGTWCSAALLCGTDLHARRAEVGNAHSDHLLGMVDAVLADASLTLSDCDAIAFAAGPGSFTGLRVACAAAQGLAFGAALPVAAIGTLDAIARSVLTGETLMPRSMPRSVLVAQDARMGEVYWSLYDQRDGRLSIVAGPALTSPRHLRDLLEAAGHALPVELGAGNGWEAYGQSMEGLATRIVHRATADAADVAYLGMDALREGRLITAAEASPIYVRNDVAQTTAQREARARAAILR